MQESTPETSLFQIASAQQGFFTARQAVECGYASNNHTHFVKSGRWVREGRGIYRLTNYPPAERPDLMYWYLWSRSLEDIPQGVFSHETALSIYELSDAMPAKMHMTVPKSFRRTALPAGAPILHKGALLPDDITYYYGVKVTSPLRTLIDLVEADSLSTDLLAQAFSEAFSKGLLPSHRAVMSHPYLKKHPKLSKKIEAYLRD